MYSKIGVNIASNQIISSSPDFSGWDPLVEHNVDARRYYLEREFEDQNSQRINLYVVDFEISLDKTSMWMLLYAYDQDESNGWYVSGDDWVSMLTKGPRFEVLDRMRIVDGGFKANFIVTAAPFSGQQVTDESNVLSDNIHFLVGGAGISFSVLCIGCMLLVGKDRTGSVSWARCKEKFEWTAVLGLSAAVCFIVWVLFAIVFTAKNVWALSDVVGAEVGSLNTEPEICFVREEPMRCEALVDYNPRGSQVPLACWLILFVLFACSFFFILFFLPSFCSFITTFTFFGFNDLCVGTCSHQRCRDRWSALWLF